MAGPAGHAGNDAPVGGLFRLAGRTGQIAEWLLGALLLFVVAVNVVNASGRYLFGYRVVGADELMVYTIIFVVMGGAVLGLARRDHININLVPSYVSGRTRVLLFLIHDLAAFAATAYAARASWDFVERIARLDTRSMALGLPMTIPHGAVFAGFVGMAVVAAFLILRDISLLTARVQATSGLPPGPGDRP